MIFCLNFLHNFFRGPKHGCAVYLFHLYFSKIPPLVSGVSKTFRSENYPDYPIKLINKKGQIQHTVSACYASVLRCFRLRLRNITFNFLNSHANWPLSVQFMFLNGALWSSPKSSCFAVLPLPAGLKQKRNS
jgi:hypothetical protein